MTRLIDADALIKDCKRTVQIAYDLKELDIQKTFSAMLNLVLTQQTIDAVPVKRGEWVEYPYCLCYEGALTEDDIACSSCGAVFNVIDNCTETFNYCPNCGADMRSKE